MLAVLTQLRARRRLLVALASGAIVGLLLPATLRGITRGLIGWNVAVWLYLALVWLTMARLDHERLRRLAASQADSASVVLAIAIGATLVAMAAIFAELGGAKNAGPAWPQLLLVLSTLVSSWLLLPTEFALAYAGRYFGVSHPKGMEFPGMVEHKGHESQPDYSDFLYFSLTIAATAQTSDVGVTTRAMRRLVIVHAVLSFAFNTAVLALAINLVASLF